MKTVRLKDIADKTGFSISTISRILSGDTNRKMKDETISTVLRTADEMGYYKTKNSKLRKAIPTLHMVALYEEEEPGPNPLILGILEGIVREVREAQTNMRLEFDTTSINTRLFKDRIEKGHVEVGILVGKVSENILSYLESRIPYLIYVGVESQAGMDEVICDAREGIRNGVKYLVDRKRTRIAFLGPTERNGNTYLGYLEGLADNHMEKDPELVENSALNILSGYEAALKLLERTKPDAIITSSDNIAIGVMRALKEKGIKCPEECALLGFDNQDSSAFLEPSLSSYDVPKKELGKFAVKLAIDRVENPRKSNIRITLPYTFMERESTN